MISLPYRRQCIVLVLLILYTTLIFYVTSTALICLFALINGYFTLRVTRWRRICRRLAGMVPLILFTAVANALFDTLGAALLVTIRLSLVCWITAVYAQSVGFLGLMHALQCLLQPFKRFTLNINEIVLMLIIAGALFQIMRRNIYETRCALHAKGAVLNLRTTKILLAYIFTRAFRQVSEIDNALRAKGVL